MMNEWFIEFIRTNPMAQQPPPPHVPQSVPIVPQDVELARLSKSLVDKIHKFGAKDFRATSEDDPKKVVFWLGNTIRVFNELSCTPDECVKCVGRMTASEYEREFVRLSKYDRECIPIEIALCKRFENGLNEDIKLLFKILELKEFFVLVDREHKPEELSKAKRKAYYEARDSERSEKEKVQTVQPSNTASRGRPPRNPRNVGNSCSRTKDSVVRFKARAPARAYAIHAREASAPDAITGHKGHNDLMSSSPSSDLSSVVCSGFQTQQWQLNTRVVLVTGLTQHLTAQADDSHAPPVSAFPKAPLSFKRIRCRSSPCKILHFPSN
ncbi:hypothetical protein Goklo_026630 [Gossypium klotzschianum]|uniref:Gag-Pol polyprotein n=1 Tax=Gossypium klotzschianum TaxID=34286 RepID=A0A7J8TVE4_9ROSI|nr:hypothetical protein [Gossypium klotzschianum]